MELTIENLGPIKKGQIDLTKNFYVFVGYNNTGKTYLAHLLWGLFNPRTMGTFARHICSTDNNTKELLNCDIAEVDTFEISINMINTLLHKYCEFFKENAFAELFNIDKSSFLMQGLSLELECKATDFLKNRKLKAESLIGANDKEYKFLEVTKEENSLTIQVRKQELDKELLKDIPQNILNNIEEQKAVTVVNALLNLLFDNCTPFYLPATRSFFPVFYQYILRLEKEKKEEMSKNIVQFLSNNREKKLEKLFKVLSGYRGSYTEPMNVLITKLANLNEEEITESEEYKDLIQQIEKLNGGEIFMKSIEGIGYKEFYFRINPDKELPMFLSSSSINQITSLYLFFKYWAKPRNNFLILDEPEENMHPSNQLELVDILMNFTHRHNKVLITTHSPLLAKALNNYLHLGYLKDHGVNIAKVIRKNKLKIKENPLSDKDIGIYAFENNSIKPYDVETYGAFFRAFKDTSDGINEISEILTDEIYKVNDNEDN